jgi:hypothetical protein
MGDGIRRPHHCPQEGVILMDETVDIQTATDFEDAMLHLCIEIENDEGPIKERYERLREMAKIAIEAAGFSVETPE